MNDELRARLEATRALYKTIAKYMAMPEWTPAMGALLVCGITPPENCIAIPQRSTRLDRASTVMTRQHMKYSVEILDYWTFEEEERKEACKAAGGKFVPRRVTPWEFVLWCRDSVPDLATWLHYFIEERSKGDPPDAINPTVVELALTMLDAVGEFSQKSGSPVYDPYPPTPPKFNHEIKDALTQAWRLSSDKSPRSVFQKLAELASLPKKERPYPLLRFDAKNRSVVWGYAVDGSEGLVEYNFRLQDMASRLRKRSR